MSVCKNDTTREDKCKNNPELQRMTAEEACNSINKGAEQITALTKGLPHVALFDLIKSSATSKSTVINSIGLQMNSKSILDQISQCENIISQSATNSIKGMSDKCIASLSKLVEQGVMTSKDLDTLIRDSSISNIVQLNTVDGQNTCKIDVLMAALTKMDVSFDNQAIQKAINDSKGLGATASSEQLTCNNMSVGINACKYMSQKQCCNNNINQSASNEIKASCSANINNVTQSNVLSAFNDCNLTAASSVSDEMAVKIKNSSVQEAKNTATGLTMGFFIIILVVLAFFFIGPVVLTNFVGKKLFYFIGPILCIVGFVLIILFFTTSKPENTRYDKPYMSCVGTTTETNGLIKSRLGEVKEKVKRNEVDGYDFVADIEEKDEDSSKITDDRTGVVVYITNRPKDGAACATYPKMKIISYIKGKKFYIYLILGICLLLCGVFVTLFGIFKKQPVKSPLNSITGLPVKLKFCSR